MNKLLVTTDFSENSRAAVKLAARIALQQKATLGLLHVYDLVSPTGLYDSTATLVSAQKRQKILQELQLVEAELGELPVTEPLLATGNVLSSILHSAGSYDLVVMGAQGEAGVDRLLLGSTVKGFIREAEGPLLVVPSDFPPMHPIKKIVLALDDGSALSGGILKSVVDITRAFDAEVLVYHLDEGASDQGLQLDLEIFLERVPYSLHFDLGEGDLLDSIHAFLEEEQGDMLCMVHRRRSFWGNLFQGSSAIRELQRLKQPFLVLQERKSSD